MTTRTEIAEALKQIRLARFEVGLDILQDLINNTTSRPVPVIIINESNGVMRLENKGHAAVITIRDKNLR